MEEQFEYGEPVEVRDHDNDKWSKRYYLMTAPEGKFRYFTVHSDTRLDGFRISQFAVYPFAQIRKIQKPEPEPQAACVITPEEAVMHLQKRLDKFEAVFNGAVKHINEQFDSIKTRLK